MPRTSTPPPADPPAPQPDPAPAEDSPQPDEHGRYRVLDLDTGHKLTIHAAALPHGRFEVLDEPASTPAGDPVATAHNESPVEPTTSGQQAES